MREHELRRQVVGEMHLRRWPRVPVPGLVLQWVVEVDADERAEEMALLDRYSHVIGDDAHPRHREGTLPDEITFVWEKHSEGSSLALFLPCDHHDPFLAPRQQPNLAQALAWVNSLPGQVIRSTAIHVVADDKKASEIVPLNNS